MFLLPVVLKFSGNKTDGSVVVAGCIEIERMGTDGCVGGTVGGETEESVISFSGITEGITSVRRRIDR